MRKTRRPMTLGIFFGILLLLLGLNILLKVIFGINLPIARVAFALFFIYLGIRLLVGGSWCNWSHTSSTSQSDSTSHNSILFGTGSIHGQEANNARHFQIVFGKGTIDLTGLPKTAEGKTEPIEISTVFGEATVLLNPSIAVEIHANSAFGEARMPNGDLVAFGAMTQNFPKIHASQTVAPVPSYKIAGNVAFGALRFVDAGSQETKKE